MFRRAIGENQRLPRGNRHHRPTGRRIRPARGTAGGSLKSLGQSQHACQRDRGLRAGNHHCRLAVQPQLKVVRGQRAIAGAFLGQHSHHRRRRQRALLRQAVCIHHQREPEPAAKDDQVGRKHFHLTLQTHCEVKAVLAATLQRRRPGAIHISQVHVVGFHPATLQVTREHARGRSAAERAIRQVPAQGKRIRHVQPKRVVQTERRRTRSAQGKGEITVAGKVSAVDGESQIRVRETQRPAEQHAPVGRVPVKLEPSKQPLHHQIARQRQLEALDVQTVEHGGEIAGDDLQTRQGLARSRLECGGCSRTHPAAVPCGRRRQVLRISAQIPPSPAGLGHPHPLDMQGFPRVLPLRQECGIAGQVFLHKCNDVGGNQQRVEQGRKTLLDENRIHP